MLSYRNMLFCTDKGKSGIYPLRIILPWCKLSCSIFTFSCTDIDILLKDIDILLTTADVRLFVKMLQESLHHGKMILNGYIPLFPMSVQNSVFLYDSTVHPYYKGGSGENKVEYLKAVLGAIDIFLLLWNPMHMSIYPVYTWHVHVYIPGIYMAVYKPGIYMACTRSRFYEHVYREIKKS